MKKNFEQIQKIRDINRFYTNLLGSLDRTLLKDMFSLTEVRIIFELNRIFHYLFEIVKYLVDFIKIYIIYCFIIS